jgi:hypothetical protein
MSDYRRLHRGDTVNMIASPGMLGTVLRVAKYEEWVDVAWWRPDGSYGWTKRQPRAEYIALVRRAGE